VSIAASPLVARGQGQAPAPSAPADSQKEVPSDTQSAAPSPGQNSTPQAPAKKVWSNEDVNGLRDPSIASSLPPAPTKAQSSATGRKPPANTKDAKWYSDTITKLQAKIPPLDDQIAELQAAIDGKPTGNGTASERPRSVKADSWPVEMDNLEKQRDGIQSQLDALYDQARRSGIPSSALPPQQ
jgi:hypothetical protein